MCKLEELRSLTAQAVWRRYQRTCPRLTVGRKKKKFSFVIHKINIILWGEVKKFGKRGIPHNICQQGSSCHIVWASFTCATSLLFFFFLFLKQQPDRVGKTGALHPSKRSISWHPVSEQPHCLGCLWERFLHPLCPAQRTGQDSVCPTEELCCWAAKGLS